jgi:hypothetical protein
MSESGLQMDYVWIIFRRLETRIDIYKYFGICLYISFNILYDLKSDIIYIEQSAQHV